MPNLTIGVSLILEQALRFDAASTSPSSEASDILSVNRSNIITNIDPLTSFAF
jgi:hypothetical protein